MRTLKVGIRTFMGACADGRWWECLGDVARGLRTIPARSTGFSPHFVVFKQPPVLPLVAALRVTGEDEWAEIGEEACGELAGVWEDLYQEVGRRQKAYDQRMLEQYQRRSDLADFDVRFIFSPGDMVLLRQREKGKMKTRSTGPHAFLRYEGRLGTVAVINGPANRELKVSAANLIPVDSALARRRHVTAIPELPPDHTPTAPQPVRKRTVAGDLLPEVPPVPPIIRDQRGPDPPVEAGVPSRAGPAASSSWTSPSEEPSALPSGVRLVPGPPPGHAWEEEVTGPGGAQYQDEDGLPRGDGGRLPWRQYARGG